MRLKFEVLDWGLQKQTLIWKSCVSDLCRKCFLGRPVRTGESGQGKEGSQVEFCCCSVAQLCLTLCNSMDYRHSRLPCPSLSPGVCSNSGPLNQWCHPTILSSVMSCPQSFPASVSFPMSWLFSSGGQSIGASASASVLATEIAVTTTSVAGYGFFSCSIPNSVIPFG